MEKISQWQVKCLYSQWMQLIKAGSFEREKLLILLFQN